MRSVADDLRADTAACARSLSPAERLALVPALGEDALALFCQARDPDRDEGGRRRQRRRQEGRPDSRCTAELLS